MSVIIGVDPSSRKMAATVSVGGRLDKVITSVFPKDASPQSRIASAYMFGYVLATEVCLNGDACYVFIERPFVYRGRVQGAILLIQCNGAAQAGFMAGGAEVYEVEPSRWKMDVMGKGQGRAGKGQVADWLRKCWPAAYDECHGDQDAIDSAVICRYGQQVVDKAKRITLPKRRRYKHVRRA